MNSNFSQLISGHSFDRQSVEYFADLSSSDVDFLYSYAHRYDTPSLRIEFHNCRSLSRITLWESGKCNIEIIAFKDSTPLLNETCQLNTMGEFEDKLLSLKEHMKITHQLH